jgi:hypothetical protein
MEGLALVSVLTQLSHVCLLFLESQGSTWNSMRNSMGRDHDLSAQPAHSLSPDRHSVHKCCRGEQEKVNLGCVFILQPGYSWESPNFKL